MKKNRPLLLPLFLILLSFSSCIFHHPATDSGTDAAMGLGSQSDAAAAQEELDRIQKDQREEQKHQLERQITDPLDNRNSAP